ncbi:class D beta-lactamase [soil metagenome]
MLNRRNVLSLVAAIIPSRAFSDAAPASELQKSLLKRFKDEGTAGTFVAFNAYDMRFIISDEARARNAILPASTFKIPSSVIALDTGVVADPDKDVFAWDGVTRSIKEWNRDHTLRTAIAVSAVPVYQEIARRIGAERMQKYLDAFDYGNRDISGGIDRFWLTGDLRISAIQQIAFLDKLRRGILPVSRRAQELTRGIMPVTTVGESIIRAKTGLIGVDDRTAVDGVKASIGWLVGWAQKSSEQTVFALNLDIREPKHIASRMKIAQQCLNDIGAI